MPKTETETDSRDESSYVVVLQCHIAKERCSGFNCENAFANRADCFAMYPADRNIRFLPMTCGGCSGRATLRKLTEMFKTMGKRSRVEPHQVVLHFASCVSFESFHGPVCPHYDDLKTLVERKGLEWREGSRISKLAARRRDEDGKWEQSRAAHPPRRSGSKRRG